MIQMLTFIKILCIFGLASLIVITSANGVDIPPLEKNIIYKINVHNITLSNDSETLLRNNNSYATINYWLEDSYSFDYDSSISLRFVDANDTNIRFAIDYFSTLLDEMNTTNSWNLYFKNKYEDLVGSIVLEGPWFLKKDDGLYTEMEIQRNIDENLHIYADKKDANGNYYE